jgi:hypothetical protein
MGWEPQFSWGAEKPFRSPAKAGKAPPTPPPSSPETMETAVPWKVLEFYSGIGGMVLTPNPPSPPSPLRTCPHLSNGG